MQVNSFFKKIRLWFIFVPMVLAVIYILYRFGVLAFTPQKVILPVKHETERGSIVDRNGKPLAVSTHFYHFVFSPQAMKQDKIDEFALDVAPYLDMTPSEISQKIRNSYNNSFIYLKKKISEEQYFQLKDIIESRQYFAARFDRIPGRIYPENDLASQLIGVMGDSGAGREGIEYYYQDLLSPEPDESSNAQDFGKNIYLTIDANLQYKLEKIAKETMETTQAESIMLLAAKAKTGEILSYVSLPSVDLNQFSLATDEQKINRPAVTAYEPGSVFKIFTVADFIDNGAITPETLFLCDGVYEKKTGSGEKIKITCLDHHGWITAREALKYSCNDALAQMSDMIDTDVFLAGIRKFGFGEKTGVELPLETRGSDRQKDDKSWSARSKPTIAMGQEISVSALQMVQAATAIANGGIPVKLTFVHKITDKDGNIDFENKPVYKDRVLKTETAQYILSCMETTARNGTGSRAALEDISIGVKTGTAQMADPVTHAYSTTDFLSNCIAIFPVENPEIILYIVVQKAKGETYAGRIVAPVIAQAADEIIDHLGMNRAGAASFSHNGKIHISQTNPPVVKDKVPDFTGRSKRDLLQLLERKDMNFIINGAGWVVSQNPPAGTEVSENMTIELYLE